MPMTGAGLSAAIKSAIEGERGVPDDDATLQKMCDALGEAIVTYIQGNAVVAAAGADPQGGIVHSTGTVG